MPLTRRERKKRRNYYRRILREHRESIFMHAVKVHDYGGGAKVFAYWGCPRCPGFLDDLATARMKEKETQ